MLCASCTGISRNRSCAKRSTATSSRPVWEGIRECSERFYWPADAAKGLPIKTDCCTEHRGVWERGSRQAVSAKKYFLAQLSLQWKFNADCPTKLAFLCAFARIARDITLTFWLSVAIETCLAVVQGQHET